MEIIAFRLHTGHSVAVPPECAVFVRSGTAAWRTRGGHALLDPNHALLFPMRSEPSAITALGTPASLTLMCDPRIDFGARPSARLIDSAAFLEHFSLVLTARDPFERARLARLVETLLARGPEKPAAYCARSPSYGCAMQQYVSSSLARPFNLAQIARTVSLSPSAASRVFHREAGLPLRLYVRRLRARTALAHIADRNDLSDIALQLGFFDHAHFTKVFRAEFGMTPSQWRDFAWTKLYKTA